MREFDPPLPEGRRYCGRYGCGREATTVFFVSGIIDIIMRSCDDCRQHFSRENVSVVIAVREIGEDEACLLEVMEDVEVRNVWSRKSLGPS